MDKTLAPILKEMCRVVGADYKAIDFKADEWYYEHEWTEEQQDAFTDWLADYLCKNKDARNTFYILRKDKKACKHSAEMFVWNHGWRVKQV